MKKFKYALMISDLLIYALISFLIFIFIPESRLDSAVFWIAWSFAIPLNFVLTEAFIVWCGNDSGNDTLKKPLAMIASLAFAVIYLIVGLIFMIFDIKNKAVLIVILSIVSVLYAIIILFCVTGINNNAKEIKNKNAKVLFIKLLSSDIDACILKCEDPECANALRALLDDVRFSDPLSNPSLLAV